MAILPVNALVVFSSKPGGAEPLGLAAGLGALQGRANIRLRRLESGNGHPPADEAARAHADRLIRDYIEPRPIDAEWAEMLIVVAPEGGTGGTDAYMASLSGDGAMSGKIVVPLAADEHDDTLTALAAAASTAGFEVSEPPRHATDIREAARLHTRELTSVVRARKSRAS